MLCPRAGPEVGPEGRSGALGCLVLAVGRLVLGDGLQLGDLADALGHALSEEQLGPHLEVLWVLDEAEAHHRLLSCSQLILKGWMEGESEDRRSLTEDSSFILS